MSSLGKTYVVFIEPYAAGTVCPINVRAYSETGGFYRAPASNEIRLATVGVASFVPTEPQIFDARRRSSFVNISESIRKQPDVENYMDVGFVDGKPFQSRNVVVVKVPTSIRTGLYQYYYDFGINSVNTSDSIKATVDAYYLANNRYDVESMGFTDAQKTEANRYISFILDCQTSAHNKIVSTIKKYVAVGTYPVVVYK